MVIVPQGDRRSLEPRAPTFTYVTLPAPGVQTLIWDGDALVDPAAGFQRFDVDGTQPQRRYMGFGKAFDAFLLGLPAGW